jgi:hypothetical protein
VKGVVARDKGRFFGAGESTVGILDLGSAQGATSKMPPEAQTEPIRQPSTGEGHQKVRVSESERNRKKPGRSPRVAQNFVVLAGTLWRKALSDSRTKVSHDQLRQIASELDAARHLPPTDYLEGKYARELRAFNSRNSNSKTGPLLTWSKLVIHGDKDHLQGMRRLLSRCAEKVNDARPVSGINSGQKISS